MEGYEDIICRVCSQSNWTDEKGVWITCECGHEQEIPFDEKRCEEKHGI